MSPILVPTLAELGIELEQTLAAMTAAVEAEDADACQSFAGCASDQLAERVSELIQQIAQLPAASVADLRVKAQGLAYWQSGSNADCERWPIEEKLSRQIVMALIDRRVA